MIQGKRTFIKQSVQDINMGYWQISYEMCIESAFATLKQMVLDVVVAIKL